MTSILQYCLVAVLVLAMLYLGFVRAAGLPLSWPMYSGGEVVIVRSLRTGDTAVNPYSVRAPGEFLISIQEIGEIRRFLALDYGAVSFEGVVLGPYGEGLIRVEDGDVVTYLPDIGIP